MGILDDILARAQQFGYRAETAAPGGPTALIGNLLPQQLQKPYSILNYLPSRLFDTLDLAGDATGSVAKMASGLGFAAMDNPVIRNAMGVSHITPESQAFVTAANNAIQNPNNGDFFQRMLAANEAAAGQNSVVSGITNLALDPSNFLTPGAEAAGLIDKTPMYAESALKASKSEVARAIAKTLGTSAAEGVKAQKAALAPGADLAKLSARSLYTDWKSSVVNRFRNSGMQDAIFNWMNAKSYGVPLGDVGTRLVETEDAARLASQAGIPTTHALPKTSDAILRTIGQDANYDPRIIGLGALESGLPSKPLHPIQSAIAQVGYGLATPRPGVPVLGSLADAVFGFFRPAHNEFYGALGHITQTSFRSGPFDHALGTELDAAGKTFLAAHPQLASTLTPIADGNRAAIQGAAQSGAVDTLAHGLFSPTDVENAAKLTGSSASDAAALKAEWEASGLEAIKKAGEVPKKIFGDFSNKSEMQKAADAFIPFLSWTRVAYPAVFKALSQNPTIAAAVAKELEVSQARVQREGLPGYLTGTVPVGTDAPLVGNLVKYGFLGGREGTANVNPLSPFSPVDASIASGDMSGKTPLDKAQSVAGQFGIGGLNPLLGDLAYATGLSDKAPGPMSVYSGIEQSLRPSDASGPTLPSLLNGVLNAARKAGGNTQISDPYETAAKEMVFERTGLPVEDPQNKKYALEIHNKTGVYLDARNAVDHAGAGRAIIQYVNPTNVTATTNTSAQYDKSKVGEQQLLGAILASAGLGNVAGMSQAQLGNMDPALAQQVYATKQDIAGANPLHDLYANAQLSALDKQDPRLTQWQLQHIQLRLAFPALYQAQELAYMAALGIPGKPGAEPTVSRTKAASASTPMYWPKVR